MVIITRNPATEEVIQNYPTLDEKQVAAWIDAGYLTYKSWRKTGFLQRRTRMNVLSKLLLQKQGQLAELMAHEMGKPVYAGKLEIAKCAWVCKHYAEEAEAYLKPRIIQTEMQKTKVCYQPIGMVFAIMPWNFPFWQVFRFAAPTIMAGNAVLLKHAPISTGTGNAIQALFIEAGFPEHLFQHLTIDNDVAAKVIAHDKISAVTLTGSVQAGATVGSEAVKHLKKIVLELGGNDPYVVLADADLELAAERIVNSRLNNSGQVCIAAKRTIVVEAVADQLIEKLIQKVKPFEFGDPLDPKTKLGPLARQDLRESVHQQVQESIEKGACLIVGGQIPLRKGYYYPATILTHVKPGMPAFDDEIFGPVISVVQAKDERHAIDLANHSQFGLGAAVFTRDIKRGEVIATDEIEAGSCFVNTEVASDPRVPFGGIKRSGFGRELSREGILEFVNVKSVSIQSSDNEQ